LNRRFGGTSIFRAGEKHEITDKQVIYFTDFSAYNSIAVMKNNEERK
jgi:hypothetical protein